MAITKTAAMILAFFLGASAGYAWEPVNVLNSEATMDFEIMSYASPIPAYCYWELDESSEPYFSISNADGEGNLCDFGSWFVQCDDSGMEIQTTWPDIKLTEVTYAEMDGSLTCTVILNERTLLSASRYIDGNINTEDHSITVNHPGGSSTRMLWEGSTSRETQLILEPGTYTINLRVYALQLANYYNNVDSYEGHLLLTWSDPTNVPVDDMSWDEVKALFR